MITPERIVEVYTTRKNAHGQIAHAMRDIRDAYNGDIVVPLPELEKNERVAVANLTAMGIDQISDRIASTVPDVEFPVRRPGFKNSERDAKAKRQAVLGWWDRNQQDLKLYRRARHLVGYGISPVYIRPDFTTGAPRWEVRDPLGTYPSPTPDPDDPCIPDCVFAVRQPYKWLKDRYPDQMAVLAKPNECKPDQLFDVLEWVDDTEIVTVVVGQSNENDAWAPHVGSRCQVLERLENRAGRCTAVVPGRINLDRRKGQFDGMVGMYQAQAKLFALEVIAVEQGIWPDEYLVARQGETPRIIQVADGRKGIVGMVKGGDFRQIQNNPGYQTFPTIDRLERAQRLTGGIPAEFGGESANNIRTGRRGENVLSATIDFGILQAHRVLQNSLQIENACAIAVDKGYHDTAKSFYVNWYRAKGQVDYKPSDLFDTDQNIVSYAQAGADASGLVIGLGQRVGLGTMSKRGMMDMDPLIEDPEVEHDRVIYEQLEAAVLQGVQSQAASGELPAVDAARIMQLVVRDKDDLAEAIIKAQKEAQERQAAQVPAGAPEAMPGLAMPGMGAESQPAPTEAPSPEGLASILRNLRNAQRTSPQERPPAEAVI